jgi:hypothetical protein
MFTNLKNKHTHLFLKVHLNLREKPRGFGQVLELVLQMPMVFPESSANLWNGLLGLPAIEKN